MELRKSRFKATSLSGEKKFHDKKLNENLQRQRSHRQDAQMIKRGTLSRNLDINDSGELSESTLRQLEVELQSTSVEVVESMLRSLCYFSVESGRTISLAPLLPSVSRFLINCTTTTSSITPTPLVLSCLAAELLANVANESSECANVLIFNASTPTSPPLFPVILSILSMIRSMEHSHESCWLTVQCLRCISGLFRNVPISQLPNHFLHEAVQNLRMYLTLNPLVENSISPYLPLLLTIQEEVLWSFVYLSARAPHAVLMSLLFSGQSSSLDPPDNERDFVNMLSGCLKQHQTQSQTHNPSLTSAISRAVPAARIVANIAADRECSTEVFACLLQVAGDVSCVYRQIHDLFSLDASVLHAEELETQIKPLHLSVWRMWQCLLEEFAVQQKLSDASREASLPWSYESSHLIGNHIEFLDTSPSTASASVTQSLQQLQYLLCLCFGPPPNSSSNGSSNVIETSITFAIRLATHCFCSQQLPETLHVTYLLVLCLHRLVDRAVQLRHDAARLTATQLLHLLRHNLLYSDVPDARKAPVFVFLKEIFHNHGQYSHHSDHVADFASENAFCALQLTLFVLEGDSSPDSSHRRKQILQTVVELDVAENIETMQYSARVSEDLAQLAEQLLEPLYAYMEEAELC